MAPALIAMDEQIDRLALQEYIALAELALDGKLQPVADVALLKSFASLHISREGLRLR